MQKNKDIVNKELAFHIGILKLSNRGHRKAEKRKDTFLMGVFHRSAVKSTAEIKRIRGNI